jgi:DNA-binding LacI/PurR family transcriptional regulator
MRIIKAFPEMTGQRRKVTSKQVAERAGVSQTTVSFVLNNVANPSVSEETRRRVLEAVQELQFVPDMAARALARGYCNNIALIISRPHRQVFIDEYIPHILTGLSGVTRANGFRVIVEHIQNNATPDAYTTLIRGKEVAGMILSLRKPSETELQTVAALIEEGFPMVSLDDWHPQIYSATVDALGGVQKAVNHLIGLGHKRIACLSFAPRSNTEVERRLNTYRHTLAQAGIKPDESLISCGSFDPETGYEAMQPLLNLDPPPTALFAMNDVMAFGAMAAIRERGLRVPEDIAVVGYDDIRLAAFANPALTTVHAPDDERGRRAGEMLMQLITGKNVRKKHIQLDTQLIVRDSCGAATK